MSPCRTTTSRGSASSACAAVSASASRPPCVRAAGAKASNQRARGTRSGGGPARGACRRTATLHRMRLASSSWPAATMAVSERGPVARSSSSASPCRARTLRGAVAVPPGHQRAAAALLVLARDLQHGGLAVVAHGQQQGRWCRDRLAVGNEVPAGEMRAERQSPPLPPTTITVSFSGSSSRATSMVRRSGQTNSASSSCIRLSKRLTWARPQ